MTRKVTRSIILIVVAIAFLKFIFLPFAFRGSKKDPFIVRVRVAHNIDALSISSKSPVTIRDAGSGNILEREFRLSGNAKILKSGSSIKVDGKNFEQKVLRISPVKGDGFELDGILYSGELDIFFRDKGIDAVNRVYLEDYLMGVLPREVYHFWPFSSLKAQAIASRSYAVYEALRRKNKEFDMTSDTFSQVYGGRSSMRWRTTRAVTSTEGMILVYDDKVFPAYFHSSCGGHTQDIARIWNEELAPLEGVKCRWCRWSPHFRWRVRVPTTDILEKLNDKGYYLKRVDDIRGGKLDRSGRLGYIRIRSGNKWFEIKTVEFRSIVGRGVLKSGNFRVKKYPTFYQFSGYGWGHGVGMCQWGAFGLSLRRWSAERILKQYYPGTEVKELYDVLGK